MKPAKFLSAVILALAASVQSFAAPETISNFASFPAYPYNTSAYKQGGAFVGCGPTTGAMMFGYFQAAHSLNDLLTSPGTGVDKGLNTAWVLHGAAYMNTNANGFGNVLNIKPGLENYAESKGYALKVMIHVSPAYTSPNATFDAYGPYGDAWTNDASFFQQKGDGTWKIDPAAFCDFLEPRLDNGIPIFLTIDSDGDGGGDHWVALVGFDRATEQYAFYDTYSTGLKWADIYYLLDSSGHKVNSISYLRTVEVSLPDIASNPTAGPFGSVTVGSWQEKTFTISNAGTADLSVTGVTLSGVNAADFSIRSGGGAFTLAAGVTRNIVVRFTPSSAGGKSASLNIASNDPDEDPFTISLSGTGAASSPDIASSAATHNYGSLTLGTAKEYIFIISNAGGSNLSVTATTLTGANAAEFSIPSGGGAFTLAAGAARNLVVRFTPSSPGSKSASLSIASDDPDENPFVISLIATATAPDIAASPATWNFGAIALGTSSDKIIDVSNEGTAHLLVSAVTLNGTNAAEFHIQSGGGPFTLAPGSARSIVVRFTPATAGSKIASLSINSDDPDEHPFLVGLSGTGVAAAPDIASNTTNYSFGSSDLGVAKETTFIISNAGNADLNVTATTITPISGVTGSEFVIVSGGGAFNLAPGATRNIVVRFIPNSAGNKTARLSIASNDPDENPFLITLVANGNGPDIAADPNGKDFGSVTLGGWQEKTVSINNVGSANLLVTAVTLTGPNASEFSIRSGGGAFKLAAGATRNIVLRFTPSTAGDKTATLSITSNDSDENPFLVDLSGTAAATHVPDIACNPSSWVFGGVQTGAHSEKTFIVSNGGDADLIVSSAAPTGANASEFSIESGGGAFTLGPSATRDVKVLFSPISEGDKTASLTFRSNDPDEDPFDVALSGTGVIGPAEPSNRVLWDLTHGIYFNYQPSHRYSDLISAMDTAGYEVDTTAHFESKDLSPYGVLIVCLGSAWDAVYTADETAKILTFVQNGGGLLILSDNPGAGGHANNHIAAVARQFGVTVAVSTIASEGIVDFEDHEIFNGVDKLNIVLAGELTAAPPADIVARSASSKGCVAVARSGSGKVVVVGDINFCENAYLSVPDNRTFAINVFDWLSGLGGGRNILVDGNKDAFYSLLSGPSNGFLQLKSYAFNNNGIPVSDADLSAKIWTAWDEEWFYLYEEVLDDTLSGNAPAVWEEDCLELSFDPQPADSTANSVWQTRLTALGMTEAGVLASDTLNSVPDSLKQWVRVKIAGGYAIELAIRWSSIRYGAEGIAPSVGAVFGMAINQHDNDGKARRQATVQWAAVLHDSVWNTPKYLATVTLLPDHMLRFDARNPMTGKTNPVPYDGTPFYIRMDGKKDPYYHALTGPENGYLQLRSYAANENGNPSSDADLSARIWTAWDERWFYLYEEVKDDNLSGSAPDVWDEDCLELSFDPQPTDSVTNSVWQTRLTALGMAAAGVVAADSLNSVRAGQKQWVRSPIPGGYILELAIEWPAVQYGTEKITPEAGKSFGLAINQHDNDGAGHDATVQWAAVMSDRVWNTPKYLGTVNFFYPNTIQFIARNGMTGKTNPIPYDGSDYTPSAVDGALAAVPRAFRLEQNYPNPFNPATTISYSLPFPSDVRLTVYDVSGRRVAVLAEGTQPAGEHRVTFDGKSLNSGIYLCRLQAGSRVFTQKMILLK